MAVARLRAHVEACVPDLRIRDALSVPGGWDSDALVVNGDLVFRFPRRPSSATALRRERVLLPALAEFLPLAVPRFDFWCEGHSDGEEPFAGYRLMPGAPLRMGLLGPASRGQVATQLAAFLTALHGFSVERATVLGVPGGDAAAWRSEYVDLYDMATKQVVPKLPSHLQRAARRDWDAFLSDERNFAFRPALVHRDLVRDHILVSPADGAITGVLDRGDAAIGDPAIDFAGIHRDFGPRFADQVLVHYGGDVDGACRGRVAFYASIVPYHEILFGLETRSPHHVRNGLRKLRRSLLRGGMPSVEARP